MRLGREAGRIGRKSVGVKRMGLKRGRRRKQGERRGIEERRQKITGEEDGGSKRKELAVRRGDIKLERGQGRQKDEERDDNNIEKMINAYVMQFKLSRLCRKDSKIGKKTS